MSKLLPIALAVLGVAGCASQPVQLMRNPVYQALGHEPGWQLAVGRREIALRFNAPGSRVARYGGVRHGARGIKSWDAGDGTMVVSVDARRGPCEAGGGLVFEDHVRVRLSGRELNGCGGRLLGRERR